MSESQRPDAYGQAHSLTVVDRFGVWLSARKLRRSVGGFRGKTIADFGCGFNASFARTVLDDIERAVLCDIALAPDLKTNSKVTAIEGMLPESIARVPDGSVDVVMCVSVLEHLEDPMETLREFRRITVSSGAVLLNVPSWRGKRALEFSAFKLGLSPPDSIDDHKCYYDPRDLWPLLVQSGFRPRNISCHRHKFGLNTFAVCRVD